MSGQRPLDGRNEGPRGGSDLLEAAQRGDREAYVDLIRPRQRRLFAIAQRILRDVDRAEDALQDALVIAWRDLRGLRDPDRFDAWMNRVLVQRLHRPGDARASSDHQPAGPAGRRTGRARRLLVGGRPGPARTRVSAALARPAGDPRPPPLPRVRPVGDRRDPRHPGRDGPLPTPNAHRAMRAALEADARGQVRRSARMTRDRDLEQLLDHWLDDGPSEVADRVFDAVGDRIARQRQRPAWRLSWRNPSCTPTQARDRGRRGHRHRRRRDRPAAARLPAAAGPAAAASPTPRRRHRRPPPHRRAPCIRRGHAVEAAAAGILPAGSGTIHSSRSRSPSRRAGSRR